LFLTEVFFQTIKLWTRKFVTTCDGAVPTTALQKGLFQRQPPKTSDPGKWVVTGEVMSLGDKQG